MNEHDVELKDKLFSALVKAQTELKNPTKNKEGYGYSYATLDSVIEQSKPVLAKYGLCVIQTLTGDGLKVGVKTTLIHESGQSIGETLWLPAPEQKGMNLVQSMGSSITYGRRYGLTAILGISAEEDTDAVVEHKTTPKTDYKPSKVDTSLDPSIYCFFGKESGVKWGDMTSNKQEWYLKTLKAKEVQTPEQLKAIRALETIQDGILG